MNDLTAAMRQHIRIARRALESSWITTEEAMALLIEVGKHQSLYASDPPIEMWVAHGYVDERQLGELLQHDLIISHDSMDMPSSQEFILKEEGAETLMTLPNVVLEAQRRKRETPMRNERPITSNTDEMLALDSKDEAYARLNFTGPLSVITARASEDVTAELQTLTRRGAPLPFGESLDSAESEAEDVRELERYVLGKVLGKGGGGKVVRAYDRVLGRCVAMKLLLVDTSRRREQMARFIAEAQTTGQLEHPNIVPIYDFGTLETGEVYYTMREVRNSSLREVLRQIKRGDVEEDEHSIHRLISLFRQVCLAIHYAHVRGVIHRDLKPDNIMLGDYGEVLVMDWGLARLFDRVSATYERSLHQEGQTLGTPAYMPPEQARGELEAVDARSDVYALGAVLYEILTLEAPYTSDNPISMMWKVVDGDLTPPRERAPERDIPEELERICMRAMAYRQETRYGSAKELHDALEDWLDGVQPREAHRRLVEGRAWFKRYIMLIKESEGLAHRVRLAREHIEEWEHIDLKREVWSLEDRLEQLELECSRAFGHAVTHFTQSLAYQSENPDARREMANLYWARFEQAERDRDAVNAIYFKALVAQYDDEGHFTEMFKEKVNLRVTTFPSGATLTLARQHEVDRRLERTDERVLGTSPHVEEGLPTGDYLLDIAIPGQPTITRPLHLERGRDHFVDVEIPAAESFCEGFIYIPSGEFISGGDVEAFAPRPPQRRFCRGFFCAEFPVTFREYLDYIDHLQRTSPDMARARAPQLRGSDGMLARLDQESGRWLPDEILIEGSARERYPVGEGHEENLPVVGISYLDALAYIQWRSERDGIAYRMLTVDEWEKAARGVDARLFPWGDRFDATFCKTRSSREEISQLEPVGVFESDCSPYGVRDMAGGVQEWCANDGPERDSDRPVKGGAWSQDQRACRLASSISILAAARTAGIGLRLAYDP